MKAAYQGETGAFSETALQALYPDAERVPCLSFENVFEAVETGRVDRGIIPIENSLHGSVHQNYDLLREHRLRIDAEVQVRIRHCLLTNSGGKLAGIKRVFSHPQALGQCRSYLKMNLPEAEIIPAYDTAGAAKMVSESGSTEHAAVASSSAGLEYGLISLANGIESNHQNYTRFLSLGRSDDPGLGLHGHSVSEARKTSILYAQKENIPGGLFKSLAVFALRDIDLFKIESRPLVGSPGKYLFYLDFSGSPSDDFVRLALKHLEEVAAQVTILGSYPVGITIE
jgi:prephenate dehydratase